ncbi:hypothetical protein AMTR_s00079p00023440 [Amborella trichopoda]|uniref:Uncharacterized protein n=1 Tax=Amborella trichopoda TaxID=13333 RepID=W1P8K2_AMBTC|nr:hypothetical protein AMTR_s00079p00023440 [Amborella trichopoda]
MLLLPGPVDVPPAVNSTNSMDDEEKLYSDMLDDMGLPFDIPIGTVYQAIRETLKAGKIAKHVQIATSKAKCDKTPKTLRRKGHH